MAMRSQVYAWDLYGGKSNTSSGAAGLIQATFTGGIPGVGDTLATMAGTEYVFNLGGTGYAVNDVINSYRGWRCYRGCYYRCPRRRLCYWSKISSR